jgi:hypothetical protein
MMMAQDDGTSQADGSGDDNDGMVLLMMILTMLMIDGEMFVIKM